MRAGDGGWISRRPASGEPILSPGSDVVHLWWIPIPTTTLPPTVAAPRSGSGAPWPPLDGLTAAERARALRFREPADRARFLLARLAIRDLSARYTGFPPEKLDLVPRERGKPELQADGEPLSLRVNLSHSGRWAILAFASHREVGVDLEEARPLSEPSALATFILHAEEVAQLRSSLPPFPLQRFFQGWTRKEALVKAMGRGIDREAASLRAGIDTSRLTLRLPTPWTVVSIAAPPGYHAAVALEGEMLVPKVMGVLDLQAGGRVSAGWAPRPPDGGP